MSFYTLGGYTAQDSLCGVERLLDQIEEVADQLNWVEVQERANALLAYDPENQDALTFLAVAERAVTRRSASPSTPPAAPPRSPVSVTATPDQPTSPPAEPGARPELAEGTSYANGRYQVKRFLGEGGKKQVYLAHDTILDRDVAFGLRFRNRSGVLVRAAKQGTR